MTTALRDRVGTIARAPLTWILVAIGALYAVGIGWGLPATDGWDNDGVAPRDFLAGLVETYSPGKFYTYPPVHVVILGVLTAPVTLVALAKATSLAQPDVIHEVLKVSYMTPIAYVARFTSLLMALGVVYALARIGEELRGRRAGLCVAAVCGVNAPLCYYAHTSNLDVPYLFWGSFALLALVRVIARREPRRLRAVAVLAVLSVGTKDQAYALFLFAAPAALALWASLDVWPRRNARALARELAVAVVIGALMLAVVDAVVINPSGFRARLHFLVGSASQDFAHYSNDWLGRALVVKDAVLHFPRYYPIAFAALFVAGIAVHVVSQRADRSKLAAGFVPLLAILSFTALFNCVARRTDHRFLLPQYALVAVYAGLSLEALLFRVRARWSQWLARAAIALPFAAAIFACADVDANLLLDPRYDAERWLSSHVAPTDTIEVHGLNVYLPRLPTNAHVERVGPEPVDKRNPLPGVVEVTDTFERAAVRRPKWIVVSQGWVWRYLSDPRALPPQGHMVPPTQRADRSDTDATGFFQGLLSEKRGYRWAHVAKWESKTWPVIDIHASTGREIWIFERVD